MGRVDGKVAIITGAGGYIGSATARLLALEGAKVVCADILSERLDAIVDQIRMTGGEATGIVTDVTDEEDVRRMVDCAVSNYGRLDILHNNATAGSGLGKDIDIVTTPDAEWDWVLKMHLYSTIWGCRHAVPRMIEGGGGSIINMASMLYALGQQELIATGVAKAAVVALTKYIASSHGKQGIRANAIAPGFALSPGQVEKLPPQMVKIHLQHALTPRLGNAADQAFAALFLASDESAFMTGQTLHVDGGFATHSPAMPQLAAEMDGILSYLKR